MLRRTVDWDEPIRPGGDPFPAAAGVARYVPRADFEHSLAYLAAKLSESPRWVGICGAPGVGKTLFLRLLLQRIPRLDPVYVPTILLTPSELERWIWAARRRGRIKERPLLLAIDDGDRASTDVLAWISELCGPRSQARAAIAWSEAESSSALATLGRCSTRVFLEPLELNAIEPYVATLLERARATPEQRSLFRGEMMQRIALASGGIPRAIHQLADAVLLAHTSRGRSDSPPE